MVNLSLFFSSRIASFSAMCRSWRFISSMLLDIFWLFLILISSHFSSICFGDVKINIITHVKDVTVVSRFDPWLVFSYAFFFVKIIHLCNAKPCFQIFFICLCPAIMWFNDRKVICTRDDSVLLSSLTLACLSRLLRPFGFNIPVSLLFFSWTL